MLKFFLAFRRHKEQELVVIGIADLGYVIFFPLCVLDADLLLLIIMELTSGQILFTGKLSVVFLCALLEDALNLILKRSLLYLSGSQAQFFQFFPCSFGYADSLSSEET